MKGSVPRVGSAHTATNQEAEATGEDEVTSVDGMDHKGT